MSKYVFDIEANGLLPDITKIHMVVFKEVGQNRFKIFTDDDPLYCPLDTMPDWIKRNVTTLIAHNGIRYDIPAMEKVLGYQLPSKINVVDTIIVSRLNNWPNKRMGRSHSLDAWGKFLGEPKSDFDDYSEYSEEMLEYCKQDCRVTERVYNYAMNEARMWIERYPKYRQSLRMEHDMAEYTAKQVENGWLFDFDRADKLIHEITDKMKEIEDTVEPHLGSIVKLIDREPKTPKYKNNGEYTAVSARLISEYLGYPVSPEDALKSKPPMEPGTEFQRQVTYPAGMGQQDSVKKYLEELGIRWTVWNWKKVNGDFIKTTPKMNDTDILNIGHPHADMIAEYYTLRSRRSILQGWMEQRGGDGRLRGDVLDLGTATGRHSHKIIANIPSGKAVYGKEMRELFICPADKVIISADGASYQIRLLAHYLKDDDYTHTVLRGDAHQRHADIAEVDRNTSKPLFFAIIFGAGNAKCASIIRGDIEEGKKVRDKLISGIPNFEALIEKAQESARQQGWILGLDGRKVFAEEPYKAVNYLIQSAEAILMKNTVLEINKMLTEEEIPYKQLLFYHDEVSLEINPEDVEKVTKILQHCFREVPKRFGVDIMEAGEVKVGRDYYAVH